CAVTVSAPVGPSRSCSGVVLSRGPGLVLTRAAIFAPFLREGPAAWARPRTLPPAALRSCPRVHVLHPPAPCDPPGPGSDPPGPARRLEARLLGLVPCGAFRRALAQTFGPGEPWRFGAGREDDEEDAEATEEARRSLHWFAWLRVPGLDIPGGGWTGRESAARLCKGQRLLVCGSPFGALCPDLFLNTLSQGVLSNAAGEDNALLLTDARCLPGTEGGGAFVPAGPRLVAVIAASFCWKGVEWVGLTLLCSLAAVLRSSARALAEAGIPLPAEPARVAAVEAASGWDTLRWAVLVDCGATWGSGVLLRPQLLLTCRHVVEAGVPLRVTPVPGPSRAAAIRGHVVFATEESSPFDVAVVELDESVQGFAPPQLANTFLLGEEVHVVGFGVLGRACGPSVTAGILSAVVSVAGHPIMLQTTCAVHGGSSGGPLISSRSGCLMGIVASNIRDTSAGATYPHLNFCIPITVLQPLVTQYCRTSNPNAFAALNRAGEWVQAVWRLQRQPGPPSKL
ncbi:TYSD1 protease, partial [Rhinopomastus cyanomelas]|nr:TYSD1 protease [Rhinopomastus cyanomelas]